MTIMIYFIDSVFLLHRLIMYRAIFLDQLLTSYTSCLNTIIVVCLDVNCVIYTALKLIQSAQLGSDV